MSISREWFVSWFDSPYYHVLYQHRNDAEAQLFMNNLTAFLKIPKGASLIDLPCGKGRHSKYLSELGYNVTGLDLSINSIEFAKKYENEQLHFDVHDMRNPLEQQFDAVLNLFTSFGYFKSEAEDLQVLTNFKKALKPNCFAVIDFINIKKAVQQLIAQETKIIDGVEFRITRTIIDGFIVKEIIINDKGSIHHFHEKVKCLDFDKIKQYLTIVGFNLFHTFGNYNLDDFDEQTSDRLILVVQ